MSRIDQGYQPRGIDMSVYLRGRNIGMPKQGLQHTQVCPTFQQMGGEGVAEHMRANSFRRQTRPNSQFLQQLK